MAAHDGRYTQQVVERLSLTPVSREVLDATEGEPEKRLVEVGLAGSGWLVVTHRFEDDGLVRAPSLLLELSRQWRVIACDEESHVGFAAAGEWRLGECVWSLVHDNEKASRHLEEVGAMPTELRASLHAMRAPLPVDDEGEDEGGNEYDLPVEAARQIVGYSLDGPEAARVELALYERPRIRSAMDASPPRKKPWWRFW